jgi:hypothetical protein
VRTGFAPAWKANCKPADNKLSCVRKWADRNDRHEVAAMGRCVQIDRVAVCLEGVDPENDLF